MADLEAWARAALAKLEAENLRRQAVETAAAEGAYVMRGGRRLLNFSGNDYLGLSRHPEVVAAAREALERYGTGAGASRLVTGNHPLYGELEAALARLKGTEAACVFGSGYAANLGTVQALAGRDDLVVADRLVHASLVDGIRLSGAKLVRFAHNDVAACAEALAKHRARYRHCLLVTETIFSMDGDAAPLPQLAELARQHDAWLLADDAHGLGVIESGAQAGDIKLGTLSKAVGGYGGYACASHAVVGLLRNTARSFIYSTGLPPSVVAGATKALEIIARDAPLRAAPLAHAQAFTSALELPAPQSAIVPIVLGGAEAALAASRLLEGEGLLVSAIRPPTVPEGSARLRLTFSALHRPEDVEQLTAAIRRHNLLGSRHAA